MKYALNVVDGWKLSEWVEIKEERELDGVEEGGRGLMTQQTMEDERWKMKDERWKMKDGRWNMVVKLQWMGDGDRIG